MVVPLVIKCDQRRCIQVSYTGEWRISPSLVVHLGVDARVCVATI